MFSREALKGLCLEQDDISFLARKYGIKTLQEGWSDQMTQLSLCVPINDEYLQQKARDLKDKIMEHQLRIERDEMIMGFSGDLLGLQKIRWLQLSERQMHYLAQVYRIPNFPPHGLLIQRHALKNYVKKNDYYIRALIDKIEGFPTVQNLSMRSPTFFTPCRYENELHESSVTSPTTLTPCRYEHELHGSFYTPPQGKAGEPAKRTYTPDVNHCDESSDTPVGNTPVVNRYDGATSATKESSKCVPQRPSPGIQRWFVVTFAVKGTSSELYSGVNHEIFSQVAVQQQFEFYWNQYESKFYELLSCYLPDLCQFDRKDGSSYEVSPLEMIYSQKEQDWFLRSFGFKNGDLPEEWKQTLSFSEAMRLEAVHGFEFKSIDNRWVLSTYDRSKIVDIHELSKAFQEKHQQAEKAKADINKPANKDVLRETYNSLNKNGELNWNTGGPIYGQPTPDSCIKLSEALDQLGGDQYLQAVFDRSCIFVDLGIGTGCVVGGLGRMRNNDVLGVEYCATRSQVALQNLLEAQQGTSHHEYPYKVAYVPMNIFDLKSLAMPSKYKFIVLYLGDEAFGDDLMEAIMVLLTTTATVETILISARKSRHANMDGYFEGYGLMLLGSCPLSRQGSESGTFYFFRHSPKPTTITPIVDPHIQKAIAECCNDSKEARLSYYKKVYEQITNDNPIPYPLDLYRADPNRQKNQKSDKCGHEKWHQCHEWRSCEKHRHVFSNHIPGSIHVCKSDIEGEGISTKRQIDEGQFIIQLSGRMIPNETTGKKEAEKNRYVVKLNAVGYVDLSYKDTNVKYLNHGCNPNSRAVRWKTCNGESKVSLIATRAIGKGEELLVSYNHVNFNCNCGQCDATKALDPSPKLPNGMPRNYAVTQCLVTPDKDNDCPVPSKRQKTDIAATPAARVVEKDKILLLLACRGDAESMEALQSSIGYTDQLRRETARCLKTEEMYPNTEVHTVDQRDLEMTCKGVTRSTFSHRTDINSSKGCQNLPNGFAEIVLDWMWYQIGYDSSRFRAPFFFESLPVLLTKLVVDGSLYLPCYPWQFLNVVLLQDSLKKSGTIEIDLLDESRAKEIRIWEASNRLYDTFPHLLSKSKERHTDQIPAADKFKSSLDQLHSSTMQLIPPRYSKHISSKKSIIDKFDNYVSACKGKPIFIKVKVSKQLSGARGGIAPSVEERENVSRIIRSGEGLKLTAFKYFFRPITNEDIPRDWGFKRTGSGNFVVLQVPLLQTNEISYWERIGRSLEKKSNGKFFGIPIPSLKRSYNPQVEIIKERLMRYFGCNVQQINPIRLLCRKRGLIRHMQDAATTKEKNWDIVKNGPPPLDVLYNESKKRRLFTIHCDVYGDFNNSCLFPFAGKAKGLDVGCEEPGFALMWCNMTQEGAPNPGAIYRYTKLDDRPIYFLDIGITEM